MDRYQQKLKSAEAALRTLFEVVGSQDVPVIQRDAAIQRFEYSFEAVWKAARVYLFEADTGEYVSEESVMNKLKA